MPPDLLGAAVANQAGSEGERPVIPGPERISSSNADGPLGLSELRRDSRALCWAAARGFEHEGTPSNGSVHSGAKL